MSDMYAEEVSSWTFPELEELDKTDGIKSLLMILENDGIEKINAAAMVQSEEIQIEKHDFKQIDEENEKPMTPPEQKTSTANEIQHQIAMAEVEKLKQEYETKIQLVNQLISKFENPLVNLDKELMELIQYIIKKSIKSLIYKEMKTDTKIVNRIIRELVELIQSRSGMISIYLSEADYQRLNNEESYPSMVYKINSALSQGDIIVKSNFTEIRAILNDRINQLLGIKYA